MASLASGTSWDACLAPACVDRVLEIANGRPSRGKDGLSNIYIWLGGALQEGRDGGFQPDLPQVPSEAGGVGALQDELGVARGG